MMIWGVSWPVSKILSKEANYETILFWRFFTTSIIYIPVISFTKQKLIPDKRAFIHILKGSIAIIIYNIFFFKGVTEGLPGLGGVLTTSLNPLFNFLLVAIFSKSSISGLKLLGLITGFLGGMIILQVWKFTPIELLKGANSYFILASITWAFLSIFTASSKETISVISYGFFIHLVSTLFFLLQGFENINFQNYSTTFWYSILYISGISTVFGTTMYFYASTQLGSAQASSFIFLVPLSALVSSWILLNEVPQTTTIIGGLLAILAVYKINRK
jgi:drug/metabolite transporter (DMT)-like permease